MGWQQVLFVALVLAMRASAEVPLVDHWKEGTQRINSHLQRQRGVPSDANRVPSVKPEAAMLSDDDLMLGGAQDSNAAGDTASSSSNLDGSLGASGSQELPGSTQRSTSSLMPQRRVSTKDVGQPTKSAWGPPRKTEEAVPPLRRPPPTSMPQLLSGARSRQAPPRVVAKNRQQQDEDDMEAELIRRMAPQRGAGETKPPKKAQVGRVPLGETTQMEQRQDTLTLSAMLKAKALFAAFVADTKEQEAKTQAAAASDKELVQVDCPKKPGKCNLTFRNVERH